LDSQKEKIKFSGHNVSDLQILQLSLMKNCL